MASRTGQKAAVSTAGLAPKSGRSGARKQQVWR